jgi:Domain of unknown function (DUF397)
VQLFDNNDLKFLSADDAAQNWRKSSRSMTNGNCVEVAGLAGEFVGVRDSMNPKGTVLGLSPRGWGAFVAGVRNGEFDRNR